MISISRRSLALLALCVAFGFPVAPLRAAPATPEIMVNGLVQKAIALIGDKQLSDDARNRQFAILFDQNFDIPRISRFVLGRYSASANADDLKAFNDLFGQWVVRLYSSRFKEYSGETVKVTGSRPESDESFLVQSVLIDSDDSSTPIDWRVSKGNDGFKILDIEVEGVSMALAEREEFASIIQNNGGSVASINRVIEQKLTAGD